MNTQHDKITDTVVRSSNIHTWQAGKNRNIKTQTQLERVVEALCIKAHWYSMHDTNYYTISLLNGGELCIMERTSYYSYTTGERIFKTFHYDEPCVNTQEQKAFKEYAPIYAKDIAREIIEYLKEKKA